MFIAGLVLVIYGIFAAREPAFWITGAIMMTIGVILICISLKISVSDGGKFHLD